MYHSRLVLGHVDSTVQEPDLLGILVERCSVQQQMGKREKKRKDFFLKKIAIDFIRNVYFITLSQFLLVSSMLALILNVQPLSNWLEERYKKRTVKGQLGKFFLVNMCGGSCCSQPFYL